MAKIKRLAKAKTKVYIQEDGPLNHHNLLVGSAELIPGTETYVLTTDFRGTVYEDLYIRISFGFWHHFYDPYPHVTWVWYPGEKEPWVSFSSVGSNFFTLSYPKYVLIEIEVDEESQMPDEYYMSGDHFDVYEMINLEYVKSANHQPPPFPYDPNNPNPPQPPQGELKLWCKVGGTVHRARKLYIKQNGILIPVKKIIGG